MKEKIKTFAIIGLAIALVWIVAAPDFSDFGGAGLTGAGVFEVITDNSGGVEDNGYYKGDADAPVTIIEFSDFECPYCARGWTTMKEIETNYVETGQVKIEFRHLPLSFHANAEGAALASLCAGEQGMFWEYHDGLFENQNLLSSSYLDTLAEELDLDIDEFDECLDSREYIDWINSDKGMASSKGITGTPAFLVNGELIKGAQPYSTFETAIEAALAEAE
ncbi:DsbA family protein [archaeon]|jgi:protein-disulfide isomerase|nr:DsbA family protein [archaeon]MBT3451037.1 DsbA family protein [archaeon]MBT6869127.1 DsbA family protein [archaeon]MBT7192774.1 DsbA family protein [archaeon]MBT7381314.1 DsbA family protein [archaeon]